MHDHYFDQLKKIRNIDLGDLVEVGAPKELEEQDGRRIPKGAPTVTDIPRYTGYLVEIDFNKIVLSSKNPFSSIEGIVEEKKTTIPYTSIFGIRRLYRDNPDPTP